MWRPTELMIVNDIGDLPKEYTKLLIKWLSKKMECNQSTIVDLYDYGDEIRVLHWELQINDDYYLFIDIAGFPGGLEHGAIFNQNKLWCDNTSQTLTVLNKNLMGLKGKINVDVKEFEHLRKLNCRQHGECTIVMDEYNDLKEDMVNESVDENEFKELVHEEYEHESFEESNEIDSENADETDSDESED